MNISGNLSINKKKGIFKKVLVGTITLALLILLLNIFSPQVKNLFYLVSSPIEKSFFTAGQNSSGFVASVLNATSLARQNEDLKEKNQQLLYQISLLQAESGGSADKVNAIISCQDKGFNLLMAGVIGLDGQDILSIDKGSADGLAEGMAVINSKNVLFGKVFKVYKNFSKVMLISNKSSVIDVEVQQTEATSKVYGTVKGNGGLGIYLDLVPVDQEIREGDVLLTSSLEGIFPKDILVGTITKLEKDDQKPFQQAQVSPFLDIKNADNLFVITNYKREK